MNIFALDQNPFIAAEMHCDKHVVKMILEYAQLLSTAHRLLDGKLQVLEWDQPTTVWTDMADTGGKYARGTPGPVKRRKKKFWALPGETVSVDELFMLDTMETKFTVNVAGRKCMNVTHQNHPSAVWARETDANYHWLFMLFKGCLDEYTSRYGKSHSAAKYAGFLKVAPWNISRGQQTPFAVTMPDEYKVQDDPIASYQAFYVGAKSRFAKWTNAPVPKFFQQGLKENYDASRFARTR